jgi:hypothetical protein
MVTKVYSRRRQNKAAPEPERKEGARMGILEPSPIDLTTVGAVLAWLQTSANPGSPSDNANIQACLTAWSLAFLNRTGMNPNGGGDMPDASPILEPVEMNEVYDGSGGLRQYVRIPPIQSCSLVQIDLYQVPQSAGLGFFGWVIDTSQKAIALRGGQAGNGSPLRVGFYTRLGCSPVFSDGIQNVQITYMGGYLAEPADVAQCAIEVVAQNYKRKNWIDQKSQAMAGGAGTTSYRDWELTPANRATLMHYTRRAIVG